MKTKKLYLEHSGGNIEFERILGVKWVERKIIRQVLVGLV